MSLVVRFESKDIKDFIRPVLVEALKDVISNEGQEFLKELFLEVTKTQSLPKQIRGDKKAGELIGLSAGGMKARRNNGFYVEGKDFYKKSDKIVIYNTDALLRVKGA